MKQDKVKYDFKNFGQAIKEARKAKGISRNQLADSTQAYKSFMRFDGSILIVQVKSGKFLKDSYNKTIEKKEIFP